jgi:lipid-A-disaccharide synthase
MTLPDEGLPVLVVAGEASGDLHASFLCEEIRKQSRSAVYFWGSGGERLARLGARLLASSHQLAAIGPVEAIRHIGGYYRLYRSILRKAETNPPRLAILVDFPDFNLPLARALKRRGIGPIVYFISPQIWAWRTGRVTQIQRTIDKMIVLLPFEVDFYRAHQVQVDYFGHPLAARRFPEKNRDRFAREYNLNVKDVFVAVLPGSRRREIVAILPVVLAAAQRLTAAEQEKLHLVIAAAPGMQQEIEKVALHADANFKMKVVAGSEQALAHCDYGLVKSGTSTLEAALAGIPFAVIYRVSPWSWIIGKCLVRTDHYALPNLILKERAVPELMQRKANPGSIAEILSSFIRRDPEWECVGKKLRQVKSELVADNPYRDAAKAVLQLLGSHR